MTSDTGEKLLTVDGVAELLGISARKAWRLLATRALPCVRVGARATRVKATAVQEYLANLPAAR